ncbi:hypothetical protein [Caproicibacter sp. BJN0012]|uniref:hypothetical protein n=1 Tax=Caproicibacter sp. BJN0012 TaxID=3110227 RepID=UPI002E15A828
MVQKKIVYSISGYRYAPESFHAYKGVTKSKQHKIPLSDEQRGTLGYLYLTQGAEPAIAFIKRVEREREHKSRLYMTYGFLTREDPGTYLFCKDIRCRTDAPLYWRMATLREFKEYLESIGGRVEQSAKCLLDGQYRATNNKKIASRRITAARL